MLDNINPSLSTPECTALEPLLADYAAQALPPADRARVAAHLLQCPNCQARVAQYATLLDAFEDQPLAMPPLALRDNFLAMLEAEKALLPSAPTVSLPAEAPSVPLHRSAVANTNGLWLRIAASVALLAIGTVLGLLLNRPAAPVVATAPAKEAQNLAAQLTAATQQPATASQRIQLVSDAPSGTRPGDPTVLVLINTLNADPNPNVRLAAAEALYRLRADSLVGPALIQALPVQTDPNVQITLIELLVKLRDKQAVPQLRRLSQRPDALPAVRDQAKQGVSLLI
ncbi:HEAT repeat domain-containing protein [Hymenobacter aerilatus]|uniref:HEAT repeat domain-containing protein n=1 Tax=Hymenobacter aerilatus TaxID=2932251 RepID=A0A8T9T1I2_9BACT|nr:HEAT repeat domain-containing protein [Hymenobacter aerilatus]UOR07687.1 HEAT repeat domain-containing protein [Hymenobacter aerilatus]